jgi:CheY-like chemotaxis protein
MPHGGELIIESARIHLAEPPSLAIGALSAGDYAEVRLSDTGIGIAPPTLHRLFEPLFTTKAKQRGHGLGLFMVQEFVSRSGSGLAVESQEGIGTEFRFLLPLAETDLYAPEEPTLTSDPGEQIRPLRVLVVDDDARVSEAVGRLLTLEGLRPSFADQGRDALEILRLDPDFDLVISDVAMPVLDGVELCKALATQNPGLPVILMSGQDTSGLPLDQFARRPILLTKPIDHRELRAALDEAKSQIDALQDAATPRHEEDVRAGTDATDIMHV